MQLTEMELFHIGEQLRSEALAISKCLTCAQQSTDPKLQQMYSRIADRHRGHYETLLRHVQGLSNQRQF
jgi:rubrerythrin